MCVGSGLSPKLPLRGLSSAEDLARTGKFVIVRPPPPTRQTLGLPGDIHIRPGAPQRGFLPGQQLLQILRIIAFIAHREGSPASE